MSQVKLTFLEALTGADWGEAFGSTDALAGGLLGILVLLIGVFSLGLFVFGRSRSSGSRVRWHAMLGVAALALGALATLAGLVAANHTITASGGAVIWEEAQHIYTDAVVSIARGLAVLALNLLFVVAVVARDGLNSREQGTAGP